jgi:predicted dehydrogenase
VTGTDDDLRVALIGYGLAGAAFHAPFIAVTPGMRLTSVVTSNQERAERARREHPGIRVLADAEPLWASPQEHDLVVVASPNRTHVPLATAALEAGLHAVVDKPLAPRSNDGRRLMALSEERGRVLTVFHNRRWDGDFMTLRRLIADGALGQVHRFESRFERWRPQVSGEAWRELSDPEEAGGVLFDLGSHLVDQALVLFGGASRVYAEIDQRRSGATVDDDVFLALTHASGVRSHLWASQTSPQAGPRMRVLGSRAGYVKQGLDVQEEPLRAGARPAGPEWGREDAESWGRLGTDGKWEPVETERGNYGAFYAGVAAALREGAPPPVTAGEAVAVLEVLEAARESAASRALVALGDG